MAEIDRIRRSSGGFHYAWVIIAILSIVQIFGQSISMSAGIMVPELRMPLEEGGPFRVVSRNHRVRAGGLLPGGFAHFSLQREVR